MNKFFTVLSILSFCISLNAQDPVTRRPTLSKDGQQIAFSLQGDIWVANSNGSNPKRITIHPAYETSPQWSDDGKSILFTSQRNGSSDLFTISSNGGTPQQLTWHSNADVRPQWEKNGVIFSSRRLFAQTEWGSEIYFLENNIATPYRLLDAIGSSPNMSPDGRYIAYEKGACRVEREAYDGSASRDIWIYDTKTKKYTQVTTSNHQDIFPDWGSNNQLYFLSAESGKYNINTVTIDNGQIGSITPLTKESKEGIRWFDVSADGTTIVYTRGEELFTMNIDSKKATKIKLDLNNTDYRFDPTTVKTYTNDIDEYQVSPDEKYIAATVRGNIIITPSDKEKSQSKVVTNYNSKEDTPQWLNDSTLLYIGDQMGNREIRMITSADTMTVNLFKAFSFNDVAITNTTEEEEHFELSPDKKQIAIRRGNGKLIVADIDEKGKITNEKVLLDSWNTPKGIAWSPDSKWLAYSQENLYFDSEIYIHAADNKQERVNVSMHPRLDYSPTWSADGSKLAFVSNRNNDDYDLWFVWLKKEDWLKTTQDWDEDIDEPKKKAKKDSTENDVDLLQIDFDNIYDRLQQVTSLSGNEGNLAISKDGKTFYFSTKRAGASSRSFMSINWDGTESKVLLAQQNLSSLQWDKAHKNAYFLDRQGSLKLLKFGSKKTEGIPFKAKIKIDNQAERAYVFNQAWRLLRDNFYDPEFHGQNWDELKKKYKNRILSATTSQDFRFFFNEMIGQLNASHMGIYGSNPEKTKQETTGLLGVEGQQTTKGYRINRVIENSPADKPNSTLNAGETIIAVNGEQITTNTNLYALLNGTAKEKVLLTIADADNKERVVLIRPTTSLRTQLYEAWIKEKKRLTDEYSNGQLGYIHIRGMDWRSFERFQRELTASGYGKKGIVIDVRFNGGGWTTDMLMAVLNVKQHAYTIPRGAAKSLDKQHKDFTQYYPYSERLPFPPLMLPSIAMCNETSYSNAEIFSHAYKNLNLGTLVGQPSFGAVISTGGNGLLDGSFLRMPFRAWYAKETGENMELIPAIPDVLIKNTPDAKAKGQDQQLKKAVELLLNDIK